MRFRLLGPLEVENDGRTLEISRPKQRALLAMLLLNANRVVSTDALIDALWEDWIPETAAKALQVYVSQLRRFVGASRLETKAPGYMLRVLEGEYDVVEFEAHTTRVRERARKSKPCQPVLHRVLLSVGVGSTPPSRGRLNAG